MSINYALKIEKQKAICPRYNIKQTIEWLTIWYTNFELLRKGSKSDNFQNLQLKLIISSLFYVNDIK